MNLMAAQVALVGALAVFMALTAGYQLLRAMQARERLIARAEDLAAPPETLSDPLRRKSFLVRWTDRYDRSPAAAKDRERLRQAYLPWKPSDYRVIRFGLGIGVMYLCAIILRLQLIPSVLLGLVAYFIVPRLYFRSRHNAYVTAFNKQLVEITQLLANALRAGMSIQQAISQVAERLPEPARGEFRQTNNEMILGDTLAQALTAMRRRLRSRDLDVVVNAIIVQHAAGGNLAAVLRAMSNVLTERQRLSSEIDSLTAEARFSTLIIMIMPVAVLLLIRDTPLGKPLFTSVLGWVLLAIFGATQVGVYYLVQRIVRIEV